MLKDIDEIIYIDGQVVNTQIKPSAFCWRPYWISRFESVWSLLRKFAYLNAINHYEIRKLFRCDGVSQKFKWKYYLPYDDLSHFGALDPSKLSIMFGIGDKGLAEATILRYVHGYEAGILTSDFLRFCPTCIYQGFHSSLHQLLFLTNCPLHGDRLEIRCTECITPTIPYKLPFISSENLSNCAHMTHGLGLHLTYGSAGEIQKEASLRENALLPIAEMLMKRVDITVAEQPINREFSPRARRRHVLHPTRRLLGYWVEVFGTGFRKGLLNVPKATGIHIQVSYHKTFRVSKTFSKLNSNDSSPWKMAEAPDLELYRIYKAIGRHLIRGYLLQHRQCIVRVSKHLEWNSWQGRICPAANALLLWRMFLEGVREPYRLFQPHRRYRDGVYYSRIIWTPPDDTLPGWVLRRIFALECVGLFHECLLLAETLYRSNAYPFQLRYVKGRRRLHWLVEKGESGEPTIHWWVSRSLSSFFSQSSSHFKSCDAQIMSDEELILSSL
jgi:hypothetical protein